MSNNNRISAILDDVQARFEAGNMNSALDMLAEILLLDSDNAEAHAKRGVILVRIGRFHEGLVHLRRAVELKPLVVDYHRSLAQSYEFRSQHDDAIRVYRTVTKLSDAGSPAHDEAIKKIAFLNATKFARSGQVDKALPIFIQLVAKYPDDFLIRYSLGLAYFFLREMDKAEVEFEKVVELNPGYVSSYLNLASIYESRGDVELAIASLEKIIEMAPNSRVSNKARERLGIIEANLISLGGNHQDALDILNEVIAVNPDSVPALILMARAHAQLGDVDKAEASYLKVLKIAPKHLEVKSQLAGLYLMSKRTGLAIDLLEKIVVEGKGTRYSTDAEKILQSMSGQTQNQQPDLSSKEKGELVEKFLLEKIRQEPGDVEANIRLAQFYVGSQRATEAYELIHKAAELNPLNIQILNIKAALASDLGKLEEAMQAYATAIMLVPDPEKVEPLVKPLRVLAARKSYSAGELGVAESDFKSMIADDPDNVMAYYFLGLIYAQEEEFLKSIDAYENVVRMNPGNFGARLNLAVNLERMNREEDAISEYRKILQENPNEQMMGDVKARLFAAEKKIKGLSASMSYSFAFDNEIYDADLNREDDTEMRSDTSFNLSYQYKMQNGVRLRLTSSPSYSSFHKGAFDYLNASNTLAATITPGKYTLVGGYTNRSAQGLLTEERSSTSDIIFTEVLRRAKFKKLFDMFSDEVVMTGFNFSFSQATFESRSSPIFDAVSYRLSGNMDQRFGERSSIKLGYTYVTNDNSDIEGSDYAYESHQLNLSLEHSFKNRITANIGYGYTSLLYVNRDSSSSFTTFRKNRTHNLSAGLAYWVDRKIRLFMNYAYVNNGSNLGVKRTLTRDEFEAGQRHQSNSLGGYRKHSLTSGFNFLF